jgi:hypothetical protein
VGAAAVTSRAEVRERKQRAAVRQVKEAGLIPEEHLRLCVVADGAQWNWHGVQPLFPPAEQLLDYYPCAERVHQVAPAP